MDKLITVFAETTFRNERRKFGIKEDDRRRHMYLIGKTGMGKSTVLENMIVEDIRAGRGVAVVDPHGDLAEKIIEYIPTNRIND
ncbi:MAG: type IV secretion system DNA-binding domain-containing protein, partial [Patescibacteria group bacterium]|nr:type IV secretion system DNA-binding domain-containing protein [Patescibacteria group bacterium]